MFFHEITCVCLVYSLSFISRIEVNISGMKLKTNMDVVSPTTYSGLCLHEIDWTNVTRGVGNVCKSIAWPIIKVVRLEMTTKQQKTIYLYLRMVHVSVPCRKNCSVIEREKSSANGAIRFNLSPLAQSLWPISRPPLSASMF